MRLFILVLFACVGAALGVQLGQPILRPQFSTVQGSQIRAVDVEVPLVFSAGESQQLYLLHEGFVCPALANASTCSGAAPACLCDYASLSSPAACATELPACCQSADPALWQSACTAGASPTQWLRLAPDQTVDVVAPPIRGPASGQPVYLRYQPAAAAQCRGFGLSVLAPFDERGDVLSLETTVLVYVSWSNARPERDPNAVVYKARPGQSDLFGRPRFCPSHSPASSARAGYFGAANTRTAFVAMLSDSVDSQSQSVAGVVTVRLLETPDVTGLALTPPPVSFAAPLPLVDRASLAVPARGTFYYQHAAAACADVTIDLHATAATSSLTLWSSFAPVYVSWLPQGFSPALSFAVNLCPGEVLWVSAVNTAASPALLTVYADGAVERLRVDALNANLVGPLLSGARAARLLCDNNNVPALATGFGFYVYTTPNGRYASNCAAYVDSNTAACQFYPLANRANASLLWPAPPTSIVAGPYSNFDYRSLSAAVGAPLSTSLRYAVVLDQVVFQSSYFGTTADYLFRSWQQLATCNIQFQGTLVTGDGQRLFGLSQPLGFYNATADGSCPPAALRAAQTTLAQASDFFSSPPFDQLDAQQQRTLLLQQAQLGLVSDYSPCVYTPQELYLKDTAAAGNCSTTDPCCPAANQYIRYFYNYCPQQLYVAVTPAVDSQAVADQGGDYECTEALVQEVAQSQAFVAPQAETNSFIGCSLGQQNIDTLQRTLLNYYHSCRSNLVGHFDKGLPCATDADCPAHPQVACLPANDAAAAANPASSKPLRRTKTCQAPTAVWDQLMFQCLVDTMPVIVHNTFADLLGVDADGDDSAAFVAALLDYLTVDGCAATGPSSLQTYAATVSLQRRNYDPTGRTDGAACYNTGTCPFPVSCVDTLCELNQGCRYPWGCLTDWSSFKLGADQQQCAAAYRCNVVATATGPTACTGDAASCQQQCEAAVGAAAFCGYCDPATGYCYQARDASGAPLSEAQCLAATDSCLIRDLAALTAQPCAGTGACTHYAASNQSGAVVTAAQCDSAPGLCLIEDGSVTFPRTAGCMGAVQFAGLGCGGAQKTDSGCLYSLSSFPTPESCIGAADPLVIERTMKGWVDLVDTEAECLGNEALFVCTLPANDTTPLSSAPNLNSRELCALRAGRYASPYRWERPTFVAGAAVPLRWLPVQAVAAGQWSTRIDYNKFAAVIKQLNQQLQTSADVLTSVCTYTNVLSLATQASSCQLTENDGLDADASCRALERPNSAQPPTQPLGSQVVCDNQRIADNVSYPDQLSIPPLSFSLTSASRIAATDWTLMRGCVSLSAQLISNSRFLPARRRIRETSFFIARQDVYVPPLSSLSNKLVPNGYILSDAARLVKPAASISGAWLCVQPRGDFLAALVDLHGNNSRLWSSMYLGLAVLDAWQVTPLPASDRIVRATYLNASGYLSAHVPGRRIAAGTPLPDLIDVCRYFDEPLDLAADASRYYVAVLTFNKDPDDTSNGFNTAETVWLYITAAAYLLPVLVWLPFVVHATIGGEQMMRVPMLASGFMALFMVFRATLLFCLASNAIGPSSTTEFALTDVAVWCQFAAVCLLALVTTMAYTRSRKMQRSKAFVESRYQQATFGFLIGLLLAVFVAFVIAYDQSGDSSGITNPTTECAGRLPAGETLWTTRRILRFTYECVLAVMALLLGLWLMWIIKKFAAQTETRNKLRRLAIITAMLAVLMLSHAIIALILIGTEWIDFIFGITMLYVTELVPATVFFVLVLWKNITAVNLSRLTRSTRTSSSRNTTNPSRTNASSGQSSAP